MGEDKSGTAFFEMLQEIESTLSESQRAEWDREFAEPMNQQMTLSEDDVPSCSLTLGMLAALAPKVRQYRADALERLGHPDPDTWHELGEWKTGEGWRLMCADDLLKAYEVAQSTGKDVFLHFD